MNIFDRFLGFLPGAKAYLAGLGLMITGLIQMIDAFLVGGVFDPGFAEGVEVFLEGFAVLGLRRGVKTMAQASAPVREVRLANPRIIGDE